MWKFIFLCVILGVAVFAIVYFSGAWHPGKYVTEGVNSLMGDIGAWWQDGIEYITEGTGNWWEDRTNEWDDWVDSWWPFCIDVSENTPSEVS